MEKVENISSFVPILNFGMRNTVGVSKYNSEQCTSAASVPHLGAGPSQHKQQLTKSIIHTQNQWHTARCGGKGQTQGRASWRDWRESAGARGRAAYVYVIQRAECRQES